MTDDTARTLNRLSYRCDLAIDKLTAPLAEAVAEAVRRHAVTRQDGTSAITPLARPLIMRDVDAALTRVYGAYRGDTTAPMHQAIAGAATGAHRTAVEATAKEIKGRLKNEPELLKRLEEKR